MVWLWFILLLPSAEEESESRTSSAGQDNPSPLKLQQVISKLSYLQYIYKYLFCISSPFPPVWGVADNKTTFHSILLAMTRDPAKFIIIINADGYFLPLGRVAPPGCSPRYTNRSTKRGIALVNDQEGISLEWFHTLDIAYSMVKISLTVVYHIAHITSWVCILQSWLCIMYTHIA